VDSGIHPDAVLVYPPNEDIIRKTGIAYTSIPLGIAYLAAFLEASGLTVGVFDCDVEPLKPGELARKIAELRPLVVGISVASPGIRYSRELISELRGRGVSSGIGDASYGNIWKIAVGGPHATADGQSTGLLGADVCFRGEADQEFTSYCKALATGKATPEGVISCDEPTNLDALPYPARHLFNQRRYKYTSVIASRGCPFDCMFCGSSRTHYRKRNHEGLRGEIESLLAAHPKSIDFSDDVFTLDRQHAWAVAEMMREARVPWACTTRADLIDGELINHLARCGCNYMSFGLETGSQKIRYMIGKNISDDHYIAAFRWCRDAGIRTRAYAMVGLPGERGEDIEKTFDFVRALNPDDVMYSPTVIYPGTRLMEYAVEKKLIPHDVWTRYMLGTTDLPVFVPGGLTAGKVRSLCFEESKRFYLTPTGILRRMREAQTLEDVLDTILASAAYVMEPLLKRAP